MRAFTRITLLSAALTIGLAQLAWADFNSAYEAYLAKNYAKAFQEFAPLAEQGEAVAQVYMGMMYSRAQGTARDNATSAKWYRLAAAQGIALAQDRLGKMYAIGVGVPKDLNEARRWFQKAAEQGFAAAQHHLATAYLDGRGVAKDPAEAVKWYRKAALQGFAEAQHNLGFAYACGNGITMDKGKAAEWFKKAAAQGIAASQFGIGQMYEFGIGLAQDKNKAKGWYRKAAAQDYKKAANRLKIMAARRDPNNRPATTNSVAQTDSRSKGQDKHAAVRPDDVAVVIGNGVYKKFGQDIPNVLPAHADAIAFKKWLIDKKGLRNGNIIFLRDATSAQIRSVFGNERSHRGQLFDWTKANISNVYVYYAGHGAPASDGGSAFLVPADANASSIELTGYPLATLYRNLKKIPAKSITLVLESCFSGASQGGYVINRTSGILVTAKIPRAPKNITIISAGKADQVASWDKDDTHSLFTKYFLLGMEGAADQSPHGNGDGKVTYGELGEYLDGTMTYFARRYYGRDQNAQIVTAAR